jgi:hypothetical protein
MKNAHNSTIKNLSIKFICQLQKINKEYLYGVFKKIKYQVLWMQWNTGNIFGWYWVGRGC